MIRTVVTQAAIDAVLEEAKKFRLTHMFRQPDGQYVTGFTELPEESLPYRNASIEPVLNSEGIAVPEAKLTVNSYGAVVLNSENMFMGDIDFGDPRFLPNAGARCIEEVVDALSEIHLLDEENSEQWRYSQQSFRVYRTRAGCRVICTSMCFPYGALGCNAVKLMRFLKCDPDYMRICEEQQCFRARLTPKPWRIYWSKDHTHVCELVHEHGDGSIHFDLAAQIELHDQFTLPIDLANSEIA